MPRYKSSPIERAAEQERKENLRNIKKKSFSAKLFVKGICTAYYIVLKLTVSASKASAFVDAFLFHIKSEFCNASFYDLYRLYSKSTALQAKKPIITPRIIPAKTSVG